MRRVSWGISGTLFFTPKWRKDRRNGLFFPHTCLYLNLLPPSFNQSEDEANSGERTESIREVRDLEYQA